MKESVLDLIYEAHQYLSILESSPRDYGTGEELFASEIHTIMAVAEHPEMNLTQLAEKLLVSKAAASKFSSRLAMRGYLEKRGSESSLKEVLFSLTGKGKTAAEGHREFESRIFGPLRRIEDSLSRAEHDTLLSYLKNLKSLLKI